LWHDSFSCPSATHLQKAATPLNAQIQCAYVMCICGTCMWVCDRDPSTCRHPLKRTCAHIWYVRGICHDVHMCQFARKESHVSCQTYEWHKTSADTVTRTDKSSHVPLMHRNESYQKDACEWGMSRTCMKMRHVTHIDSWVMSHRWTHTSCHTYALTILQGRKHTKNPEIRMGNTKIGRTTCILIARETKGIRS